MKANIVVDSLRQLNLHPLVVYFVLGKCDYDEYGQLLNKLSNYKGFSRDIFKFKAIEQGGRFSGLLGDDVVAQMQGANMVVRLVDDVDGNFCYALGNVDLSMDPSLFDEEVQEFVIDVCQHNIDNIDRLQERFGQTDDEDSGFDGRAAQFESFKGIFERAINEKGGRKGVWSKLISPDIHLSGINTCSKVRDWGTSLGSGLPSFRDFYGGDPDDFRMQMSRLKKHKGFDYKSKEVLDAMIGMIEAFMDVPSEGDSDENIQGAVDESRSENFTTDQYLRQKYAERPQNLTISVAKVATGNTRIKINEWGVVIGYEGKEIPVYFGNTTSTMIYVCTLLRQKMGKRLYKKEFRRSIDSKNRDENLRWMRSVYRRTYLGDTDFDVWYQKLYDYKTYKDHHLNQSVSTIRKALKKLHEDIGTILYYVNLSTQDPNTQKSYYFIDIPAENIIVPKELEDLVDGEI